MKKLTILVAVLVSMISLTSCKDGNPSAKINKANLTKAISRDVEIKKGNAMVSFDNKNYDFGIVNEGDIVEKIFKITNTGKTDLVITDAKGSCGCTVPTWPKAPIKSGETADVAVKFNTSGKPNKQYKTVTLTTNTETGREVLTLKGSVIPKTKK